MKRKELLMEVYNEPLIQELLKNKTLTPQRFVDFLVLEGVLDNLDARDRADAKNKEITTAVRNLESYLKNGVKNFKELLEAIKALNINKTEPGSIRLDDTKFIDSVEREVKKAKEAIKYADPKDKRNSKAVENLNNVLETLVTVWPELRDLKPDLIKKIDQKQKGSAIEKEVSHKFNRIKLPLAMALSISAKIKNAIHRFDDTLGVTISPDGKRSIAGDEKQKGIDDILRQIDEIDSFLNNYLDFDRDSGEILNLKDNDSDPVDFMKEVTQEILDNLDKKTERILDLTWSNLIKSGTWPAELFPEQGIMLGSYKLTPAAFMDIYNFLDKINANKKKIEDIRSKFGQGIGKIEKTVNVTSHIIDNLERINDWTFDDFLIFKPYREEPREES